MTRRPALLAAAAAGFLAGAWVARGPLGRAVVVQLVKMARRYRDLATQYEDDLAAAEATIGRLSAEVTLHGDQMAKAYDAGQTSAQQRHAWAAADDPHMN